MQLFDVDLITRAAHRCRPKCLLVSPGPIRSEPITDDFSFSSFSFTSSEGTARRHSQSDGRSPSSHLPSVCASTGFGQRIRAVPRRARKRVKAGLVRQDSTSSRTVTVVARTTPVALRFRHTVGVPAYHVVKSFGIHTKRA